MGPGTRWIDASHSDQIRVVSGSGATIIKGNDRAYLAGILDSDGSIYVLRKGRRFTPVVSISNTSKRLLVSIRRDFGGTLRLKGRKNHNVKWKLCWGLQWEFQHAGKLLVLAMPHLRLKRRQVKLVTRVMPRHAGYAASEAWRFR